MPIAFRIGWGIGQRPVDDRAVVRHGRRTGNINRPPNRPSRREV